MEDCTDAGQQSIRLYSYASIGQLLAQMLSAPASGFVADKIGMFAPCFVSLLVAGGVCFALPWVRHMKAVFALLVGEGIVVQTFLLAETALIVRTLPSASTQTRDMCGVLAMTAIGQALATMYSGTVLGELGAGNQSTTRTNDASDLAFGGDRVQYDRTGYMWAFLPMGGVAVLGACLLLPLRKLDAKIREQARRADTMATVASVTGTSECYDETTVGGGASSSCDDLRGHVEELEPRVEASTAINVGRATACSFVY